MTLETGALRARRRVKHAVVEADALDLAWPPLREHGLAERNLEAIMRNDMALGYDRLVYCDTAAARDDTHKPSSCRRCKGRAPGTPDVGTGGAGKSTVRSRLAGRAKGSAVRADLERSARAAVELERCRPPGLFAFRRTNVP